MAVAAVGEDAFVWCEQLRLRREHRGRDEAGGPGDRRRPTTRRRRRSCTRPTCPGSTGVAKHLEDEAEPVAEVRSRSTSTVSSASRSCPATARSTSSRWTSCSPDAVVGLLTDADFAARPELPKGYIGPDFDGREARRRGLVGPRAAPVDHRRERDRPPRARLGARPRLHADAVGRDRGRRTRRRLPGVRAAAAHRPRHRGRPRLPARHQVHRGARRALHRRGRRAAPDGHGLLRHRREPHRRRGRRGAPRRERHRVAGRTSRRSTCTSSRCPATRPRARPRSSAPSCARRDSTCSTTIARGDPGVKFADADLVGMPVQIIVGSKGLARGIVERKVRATGERDEIPRDRGGRDARRRRVGR